MANKIVNTEPICLEEVKKLLEERDASSPLNYIQRVTMMYAHQFSKDVPQSKILVDQLREKFSLELEQAIQLVAINPQKKDEIEVVLDVGTPMKTREEIFKLIREHIEIAQIEEEAIVKKDIEETEEEIPIEDIELPEDDE